MCSSESSLPNSSEVCSSGELFKAACRVIPGGVNSPVRAFKSVGGTPRFIQRGEGPYLFDAEGRKYLDYVGSWGPLILGHCARVVEQAIESALRSGTSFGAPTAREVEFAELLSECVPSVEMVRLVNSGTEATMTALRLARGYTKRDKLIKARGCYHGHADAFLVQAGSGLATFGISSSSGVPEAVVRDTLSVDFNDADKIEELFFQLGPEQIAAVIIEPVCGNMGLVLPEPGYLEKVREICSRHGALLIFDEVMSGFRVALGGAQERFGVLPDLTTLGKVIGGGLPVGAVGGRREIMELLSPSGPVYQAGTLSGNPLCVAAGMAQVAWLKENNPYAQLEKLSSAWATGLHEAAEESGVCLQTASCGAMVGLFFSDVPVRNFTQAQASDVQRFSRFFHAMLDRGIYLAPSAFEAGFVSTTHEQFHIEETIAAARAVFASW
jgi:glutamate-1-semialdehyde 2,1-aminomutase